MSKRARGKHLVHGVLVLGAMGALLAACGSKKSTVAGNDVQMRDMEVVDGTVNDAMTDLDAVKADGVGVGTNAGNASAGTSAKAPAAAAPAKTDSETVSPE